MSFGEVLQGPVLATEGGPFLLTLFGVPPAKRRLSRTAAKEADFVMPLRGWVNQIRSLALCLVVLAIAMPAAAQDVPKVEVSGGYSVMRLSRGLGINLSDVKETLHGWYVDVTGNETRMLAVVAQGGGNYQTVKGQNVKVIEFAAGARLNRRMSERTLPFVQVLFGVTHFTPNIGYTNIEQQPGRSTNASLHVGGGVNLTPAGNIGVRVGAEYVRIFTEGSPVKDGKRTPGFRVTAGLVLPFGAM